MRTSYGLHEWLEIDKGVRRGCIISPHLFNIYAEDIMRNGVGGRKITNLRYADGIFLIAGSLGELQKLVNRVKLKSEKAGLFIFISFFILNLFVQVYKIRFNRNLLYNWPCEKYYIVKFTNLQLNK